MEWNFNDKSALIENVSKMFVLINEILIQFCILYLLHGCINKTLKKFYELNKMKKNLKKHF